MTVTTNDARAKLVYASLIDKVSSHQSISDVFTQHGNGELMGGESIDIVTRANVTLEAATSSGTAQQLSIQTISPSANNLLVDQHYGAAIGINKMSKYFDMMGSYADQLAQQVLIEIQNKIDQQAMASALTVGAYDTSASYWVNVAGDALSAADIENAYAKMTAQYGVRDTSLVWVFHPYGIGSVRACADFVTSNKIEYVQIGSARLGIPVVGYLHGIPVVRSQNVPTSRTVATTAAVTSSSGTVHTYTVAAGHGLVPGQLVTVSGHDAHENISTATAITSVAATSVVVTTQAATTDGTSSDADGTITASFCHNALINTDWCHIAKRQVPEVRIVPQADYIRDVLQADAVWGTKCLLGGCIGIASPASSVS